MEAFEMDTEACALIIEDLKSEDHVVKLEAAKKLKSIAKIIGSERIKEELVPYLIEIIEEKDNDDEFLLQLINQVYEFREFLNLGDIEHLLPPLEILASMEEPGIRDQAVEKIRLLSENQSDTYFTSSYLGMIKRLALWDNYPSRVSACSLFHVCYNHISDKEKIEIRQLYSELAHDDTPMVRRAAAINLKNMIKAIEKEYVVNEIISIFNALIRDPIDAVKINAIENSVNLISFYSKSDLIENLLPLLKNADPDIKSWRVRYSLAETLHIFCASVDNDVVRKEIFPIYDSLLKDPEQEVKSIAILKVNDIMEKLTKEQIENNIITSFKNLCNDSALHVRISVATIISTISQHLTAESLIHHMLPLIQTLLKDEVIEVKTTTIENLHQFNKKIGPDNVKTHVIPLIMAAVQEKQWRCRYSIVKALPMICESLGFELFESELGDFFFKFATDHYYLIREQAIDNISKLIEIFGCSKLESRLKSVFFLMIENTNYLFRIAALNAFEILHKQLDRNLRDEILNEIIDKISNDKVPNVKFTFAKVMANISGDLGTKNVQKYVSKVENLKNDKDPDVSYFASKSLEKIKNVL